MGPADVVSVTRPPGCENLIVSKKVPEDLAQARRIADDPAMPGVKGRFDLNPAVTHFVTEHLDDFAHNEMDVDTLLRQHQAISRDPRDVEEIVDETHFEIEIPPHRLQRGQ